MTSGVLIAACLSVGTPIFITPTVSLSVFTRPSARRGLSVLHDCNGRVVRPTSNRLTDRLMKGKHVRRPRGVVRILRTFFTHRRSLTKQGVIVATNPACRGVSPIHFVNGCSSKGVNCTLTRTYTSHKTRIMLIDNPIALRAIRPGVRHVSMRGTTRVRHTATSTFGSTSTKVLYTTMTSFAPRRITSRGVGQKGSSLILQLGPAYSVTTSLKGRGHPSRLLINFTLRAYSRIDRTRSGLTHGGFSFVILGSLGSGKTNFHYSAGGVAVVSHTRTISCPLGHGRRITRSVISGLSDLFRSWAIVLRSVFVRGCTLVSGLSVSFASNFSIVANRANTKGSVVLKTVKLLLKRHTSIGSVGGKTSGYVIRTAFQVTGCNVRPFFRRGSVRFRPSRYVLHHRISTGKGDHTFVGSAPTSLTRVGVLNRGLVSMRDRRRGLLLGGRKFRLGVLSVLTRSRRTLSTCRSMCLSCGGITGRLSSFVTRTRGDHRSRSCVHFRLRRLRRTKLGSKRRARLRRRTRALDRTRSVGTKLCETDRLVGNRRNNAISLAGRYVRALRDLARMCTPTGR